MTTKAGSKVNRPSNEQILIRGYQQQLLMINFISIIRLLRPTQQPTFLINNSSNSSEAGANLPYKVVLPAIVPKRWLNWARRSIINRVLRIQGRLSYRAKANRDLYLEVEYSSSRAIHSRSIFNPLTLVLIWVISQWLGSWIRQRIRKAKMERAIALTVLARLIMITELIIFRFKGQLLNSLHHQTLEDILLLKTKTLVRILRYKVRKRC